MWINISAFFNIVIIVVLNYSTCSFASHCYSDFCHKNVEHLSKEGLKCLITTINRKNDCVKQEIFNQFKFNTLPKGLSVMNVKLSAYTTFFPEYHLKVTAFNFTIKDTNFQKLVTRYRDEKTGLSHCRTIQLFGHNETDERPELYFSCPFFPNSTFEGQPYGLEYSVIGEDYEYNRKLVFKVPNHVTIDDNIRDIKSYIPFIYVDMHEIGTLHLYIQPVPKKFNVSSYKVWLLNDRTDAVTAVKLSTSTTDPDEHLYHVFNVDEDFYHFKVSAMHPDCGEYGCVNSTSIPFDTRYPKRRLLIMIVSVVWIPPVILYAIYYMYKLYRKRALLKRMNKRPNCLLVYSPTHLSHVNVISNLAKYLRACNINAMIDQLDIPETDTKDPGVWCNKAFQNADVIVVASSPAPMDVSVPVIYQNMDNHALRLIKENYSWRNKRYAVAEFVYCKPDDIPEEAQVFKRFRVPDNLEKLVRYIHNVENITLYDVSNKDLMDSIAVATTEIPLERPSSPKSVKETDGLLPESLTSPIIKGERKFYSNDKLTSSDKLSVVNNTRCYTTKLDDLNLLGECTELNAVNNPKYESPGGNGEFCIGQLNL